MNPSYRVDVIPVVPAGDICYAVRACPRCGRNMGINIGMRKGMESIICMGKVGPKTCGGHYYLHGDQLEFVGSIRMN